MRVRGGGCPQAHYSGRGLLGAALPPVQAPSSLEAQRSHLERALGATTAVLFAASVSYIVLSTLHGCLCAGRPRQPDAEPAGAPRRPAAAAAAEETKRALQEIPVVVLLQVQARDGVGVGLDRDGGRAEKEEEDCAVCLAAYAGGEEVRVLPACRHGFHRECVDRWLLTRAPTCPVCRAPLAARADGHGAKG